MVLLSQSEPVKNRYGTFYLANYYLEKTDDIEKILQEFHKSDIEFTAISFGFKIGDMIKGEDDSSIQGCS